MPFGTSSQLGEALTAGQVTQLIQKRIDPTIVDLFRRYSPLMSMIPTKPWDSTMYYWNSRRSLPPGGFVRDGGARPLGNSTWAQAFIPLANLQTVGSVSGFAQATTRSLIGDLFREEYDAASKGLVFDIETGLIWGNAAATANGPWPQFDGLNTLVAQYSSSVTQPQNAIDEAGNVLTTGMLDRLIDMVRTNAAMPVGSNYTFVMTSTAHMKVEQLITAYQRYVDKATVGAGLEVTTYKGIPITMSSFMGSALGSPMGAVTATPGATGGMLPAGDYYYVVVPVMARAGLGAPSATVHAATTGATGVVNLQFAPPQGPNAAMPLLYEVYRGTAAGAEVLLGVVDAAASLAADGITPNMTTGIVDTGVTLVPTWNAGTMVPPPGGFSPIYVGGTGQRPRLAPIAPGVGGVGAGGQAGGEDIFLVPTDADILCRPYVRDIQMVSVAATVNQPDALPFALVTDTCLAVRAPQFVGRLRNCVAALA